MMDFNKNNLDKSLSPYLQQHIENPINWQEWSQEVLDHAKKVNKPLFVSVGYATCHWCHVMAREAFSDPEIAKFLNENFISIKVDREQRPDIDSFFMSYIIEDQGHGGWPLNVFLTPNLKPYMALTYVPVQTNGYMPGFMDVLEIAKEIYSSRKNDIRNFVPSKGLKYDIEKEDLIENILRNFDTMNGGFGPAPKFPSHNTLLLLLHYYELKKKQDVRLVVEKTLDVMLERGLHDHLQGGFYRYCTDVEWTIPHFEKMLYDQTMLLWVYSIAYKVLKKDIYKKAVEKLINCLKETFESDGLYYSAHDADTHHEEGFTYLWTMKELKEVLGNDFEKFSEVYEVNNEGNFEGKNHLIKRENIFLEDLEEKLLEIRKKRDQPFTDKKLVTSWNALLAIAFISAHRYLYHEGFKCLEKSLTIYKNILEKHYKNGFLSHSSLDGKLQKDEFLEDYSSLLLLATYIHEETGKEDKIIKDLLEKIKKFYKDGWIESNSKDFIPVYSQKFDHPIPSSFSLAEFATLRAKMILGLDYEEQLKINYGSDFYNLMVFFVEHSHIIKTPEKIDWSKLPLFSMQLLSEDGKIQDCYKKMCRIFESKEELLKSIGV